MRSSVRKVRQWFAFLGVVFIMSAFLPVKGVAQTEQPTFSVSFKDKDLASILDYISRNSSHRVIYDNEVKTYTGKITVSFDQVTAVKAVQEILVHTPFCHSIEGKTIKVYRMETGQSGIYQITGIVQEANGLSIPNATVQLKGVKKGTVANTNGEFSLSVEQSSGELTISSIGFTTKTVKYVAGKPLKVVLAEAVNTLGEVSIIAYGERKTRELVGSVSTVKSARLQDMPTPTIETLLQGQMSGVEVSNISGTPGGGGSKILIRGFSSLNQTGTNDGTPLFVIDGVPVQSVTSEATGGINTLAGLDPTTIESVEVLKDAASASLYGSRAGNGVVLITTKKGKTGRAEFTVNFSQSLSYLPKTPLQTIGNAERQLYSLLAKKQRIGHHDWETGKIVFPGSHADTWGWDAMYDGAYDYFWFNGHVATDDNKAPSIVQDSLNTFYNNKTNWWDYIFRVGKITKADVQASGGNDNIRYLISAGIYDETGIMINSSFQRASILSNIDLKLTPKLSGFTRINLSYTDKNAGSDMGRIQGLTADPKSTPSTLPGKGTIAEIEALKQLRDIDMKNSNYNVRLNIGLTYELLKGLKFSATGVLDHYFTRSYIFTPNYLTYNTLSEAKGQNIAMTMLQSENLLTYKFNLREKHFFDLLAGVTYNRDLFQSLSGSAQGGPTNQIRYVGEGWPRLRKNAYGDYEAYQAFLSNREEQIMMSWLGRIAYNYKQKYLAEFSIRSDGSSVFGADVRWATFPAAGIAWAFSDEDFMKDLWWLSFGKLRASWGKSGQKFQEAYLAHGVMQESNTFLGNLGLIPSIMVNRGLTWEKSDQLDLGIDLHLLNHRFKLKFDYYYKYSSALLMQMPLPGNFFLSKDVWGNSSSISNEGVEFEVTADILKGKPFEWTMSFNISRNWNMLRSTYNGVDLYDKVLGRPIYGIYTYKDEGIVQKESEIPYYYNQLGKRVPLYFKNEDYPLRVGGRKLKDQNMDGKIDESDLYYAGSTIPKAYGGITNHFTWKGFTLNVLMNYTLGRKVINIVKGSAFNFTKNYGVIMADLTKARFWTKPGDHTPYPSLEFSDSGYIGQFDGNTDSNIENISFLRLKQLTLSYNFPKPWFEKVGIKDARVYLSGENLFLISNYSGIDPETIDPHTGRDEGKFYPLNRKFTLGFNLKF